MWSNNFKYVIMGRWFIEMKLRKDSNGQVGICTIRFPSSEQKKIDFDENLNVFHRSSMEFRLSIKLIYF